MKKSKVAAYILMIIISILTHVTYLNSPGFKVDLLYNVSVGEFICYIGIVAVSIRMGAEVLSLTIDSMYFLINLEVDEIVEENKKENL